MRQSNLGKTARALAALLLAIGLPVLALAATPRSKDVRPASTARSERAAARAERLSPVLEFLAESVGNQGEPQASPHEPPGQPPGRPPAIPPGLDDPPNPPGRPLDRPPSHANGG